MKKATFQQTTMLLLLSLFLLSPLGSWAQATSIEEQCQLTERHILERGGELTAKEGANLCGFIKELNLKAIDACPAPTNLRATIDQSTGTVQLDWDPEPAAIYYTVSYYDINNGTGNSFNVDVPTATIPGLPPAEYYMAVQSVCEGGYHSEPEGIYLVIIGDIAILRQEPSDECRCTQYNSFHGGPFYAAQTIQSWAPNLGCGIEQYDLNINMAENGNSGSQYDIHLQVYRDKGMNPNDIAVSVCNDDGMQVEFRQKKIKFRLPSTGSMDSPDLKLQFSYGDGFIIYPQNGDFDYNWSISHCCNVSGGERPNDDDDDDSGGRSDELNGSINSNSPLLAAPNPFSHNTRVDYTILEDSELSLVLHNSLGQPIRQLQQGFQQAGEYQAFVDGTDLTPGLYFIHLKTKKQDEIVRMIKL